MAFGTRALVSVLNASVKVGARDQYREARYPMLFAGRPGGLDLSNGISKLLRGSGSAGYWLANITAHHCISGYITSGQTGINSLQSEGRASYHSAKEIGGWALGSHVTRRAQASRSEALRIGNTNAK